jgi:hypothetical protein
VEAEVTALELALFELRDRRWLPRVDELDNIVLKQKLVHNILPHEVRQTELQDILDRCKEITYLNCIQVHWRSWQSNPVANYLVEYVNRNKTYIFDTDFNLKLCHITWGQCLGPLSFICLRQKCVQKGDISRSS